MLVILFREPLKSETLNGSLRLEVNEGEWTVAKGGVGNVDNKLRQVTKREGFSNRNLGLFGCHLPQCASLLPLEFVTMLKQWS